MGAAPACCNKVPQLQLHLGVVLRGGGEELVGCRVVVGRVVVPTTPLPFCPLDPAPPRRWGSSSPAWIPGGSLGILFLVVAGWSPCADLWWLALLRFVPAESRRRRSYQLRKAGLRCLGDGSPPAPGAARPRLWPLMLAGVSPTLCAFPWRRFLQDASVRRRFVKACVVPSIAVFCADSLSFLLSSGAWLHFAFQMYPAISSKAVSFAKKLMDRALRLRFQKII